MPLVSPLLLAGYDFASVFPAPEAWTAGGPLAAISDAYDPADASPWSVSFPETDVFAFSLKGTSSSLGEWAVRVGKGGQIFSIRANGQEWIPPQFRAAPNPDAAPWVDEVTMPVSVNTALNTEDDPYFIHGAGIYLRDNPLTATPFYSPLLAATTVQVSFNGADDRLDVDGGSLSSPNAVNLAGAAGIMEVKNGGTFTNTTASGTRTIFQGLGTLILSSGGAVSANSTIATEVMDFKPAVLTLEGGSITTNARVRFGFGNATELNITGSASTISAVAPCRRHRG